MLRQATRFLRVARRSSQSALLLRSSCRYLEATLDGLLAQAPTRSSWWEDGRKSLMRGAEIRRMHVWRQTPYDPTFSVPSLAKSTNPEEFRDEAIWHVARHIDDLYVTIPLSDDTRTLVELENHRYHTHLGASILPSPQAHSKLPVLIWDIVLRDLAHSVWADFLLWCLQHHAPTTRVGDLIVSSASTLEWLTAGRRPSSTPLPGGSWETALGEALQAAHPELAALVSDEVASITYDALNSAFEDVLSLLPSSLGAESAAKFSSHRETLIAAGCLSLLPRSDESELDYRLIDYLSHVSRRRLIEASANTTLEWHAAERDHEVLLELRAELADDLEAEPLGFSLLRRPPEGFVRERQPDGVETEPPPSLCYAHFPRIYARHAAEAVHLARTVLAEWFSLLGVFDQRPLDYHILRAWAASADLPFPMLQGPIVVPLALAHKLWTDLLSDWQDLLNANDDMATRIRQAIVHLDRAQRTADVEEGFDEAWTVLEILAGNATRALFATVCYLPLYFVPQDFDRLPTRQREALVAEAYERHKRYLSSAKVFRNQRVVHREFTGTDVSVLDHNARWLLSFGRTALRAAISSWQSGARSPREMVSNLRSAYEKNYGMRLPA